MKDKKLESIMNDFEVKIFNPSIFDIGARSAAPHDWNNPDWSISHKCNNWRNYATSQLRHIWSTLTNEQKIVISHCLQEIADSEERE
jgi:hypothetical protein